MTQNQKNWVGNLGNNNDKKNETKQITTTLKLHFYSLLLPCVIKAKVLCALVDLGIDLLICEAHGR